MIDNFFSAGRFIIEHLKANVDVPVLNVRMAPNLEWVLKNALDKSINVVFWDDQPVQKEGGAAGRGANQSSTQYWIVILSIKDVSDYSKLDRTNDAGYLAVQILKTLQGHCLSKDHRPLKRERCPIRNPLTGVFIHVPFMFSTNIIF